MRFALPDHALSFKGATGTLVMPGEAVVSDPFEIELPANSDLAISIHFGEISNSRISWHRGSPTDSLIALGDKTAAAELPSPKKATHSCRTVLRRGRALP